MKDVLTWIIGSRSMWISGVTVALTAAILKYGQSIGLTEDAAKQVAGAVLVVALAVLGKLAAQNVTATLKGGGK